MENSLVHELRRIATDLESAHSRFADAKLERQLEEIRIQFVENLKRDPMLKHLDGDKMWDEVRDSVRRDIRRRPFEWRD
jgi:hypothetical protein